MDIILETERLTLRKFNLDDTHFIIKLVNSEGWLKNIGDRNIKTEEQARNYLQNGPLKSYSEHGFGLWLVELKADQVPIGICGILKRDTLETPDIGFAFLPEFTGQGFAFEVASATMAFAKNDLKIGVISAITVPGNTTSIKLLEKLGFKFSRKIEAANGGADLLLFSN